LIASFALRVAYTTIGIVMLFMYMLSVLGSGFFSSYWLPVGLITATGMLWGLLLTLWFLRCVLRYFLFGGNEDTLPEAVVGRAMHDRMDAGGQSRGVTADAA
jgi:hypothetical protein